MVLGLVLNFRKFKDFRTSSHLSGVTSQMSAFQYVRLRALSEWRAEERIILKFQTEKSPTRATKSLNRGKKKRSVELFTYKSTHKSACNYSSSDNTKKERKKRCGEKSNTLS